MRGSSNNEEYGGRIASDSRLNAGLAVCGRACPGELAGLSPVPQAENEGLTHIGSSNISRSSQEVISLLISLQYHGGEPYTPRDLSPLRTSQRHRQRPEPRTLPPRTSPVHTKTWPAAASHILNSVGH